MLIACLTFIPDSGSGAEAPAAEKVYIVDSDQNQPDSSPGDGICATSLGNCTLRAAVQEANRDQSGSRINFASKMKINYPSLEALTEPFTTIDASDQWDNVLGEVGVVLSEGGNVNGILAITGDYAVVRGLQFEGEGSTGIVVSGSWGTIIGGDEPVQRNVFIVYNSSNIDSIGVEIKDSASKTDIRGNFFGTEDGVYEAPNPGAYGVYLTSGDNTVRENHIVGHTEAGILGWMVGHNLIMDNVIGTSNSMLFPLPNEIGVSLYFSDENQIGPGNIIYNNNKEGILISQSDNNVVAGNEIHENGGHGIQILSSTNSRIGVVEGNSISANIGHGVFIDHGDNTRVIRNVICANEKDGIYVEGSQYSTIGGSSAGQENKITKNSHGVHFGTGANNNKIIGNEIGYPFSGCGYGNNQHGVLIDNSASNNQIGGLDPGEGNWISKNLKSGIYITGSGTTGNVVEGNVLGAELDWSQTAPNSNHGIGIYDGASGNWIGWFNTILASGWSGIVIVNSSNNVVWFNNIGTDGADINWGNQYYGIHVVNSPGNQIVSNRIHNNGLHGGEAGVRIQDTGSVNNFISLNSITNNSGLGIELFNGANYSQPAPTITSGSCTSGVSGIAFPGSIVEIFSDGADEGRFFETSVTADASTGAFSWSGSPAGPNLTATSSDVFLGSTSQFSTAYPIGVCNNPPTAAFTFAPDNVNRCTLITFDASTSSDIEDAVQDLQVRWDWENDGTFDTGWSNHKVTSHQFPGSGLHTVRMEVMDSGGLMSSTTRQVTINAAICGGIYLPLIIR
jgi:parallel beta-helix repeat protein